MRGVMKPASGTMWGRDFFYLHGVIYLPPKIIFHDLSPFRFFYKALPKIFTVVWQETTGIHTRSQYSFLSDVLNWQSINRIYYTSIAGSQNDLVMSQHQKNGNPAKFG